MSKATEKSKYRVLRPIVYKGERVEAGTVLEVDAKEGKDLLDAEYVKLLGKGSKEEEKPAPSEDDAAGKEDAAAADDESEEGSDIEV